MGLGTRLYLNNLIYNILIFIVTTLLFSIYFIITNVEACKNDDLKDCGI